jgi:hypothetical protein
LPPAARVEFIGGDLSMVDDRYPSKLVDALVAARHKGLTVSALEKKLPAAHRDRAAIIVGELKAAGRIRGPFKSGRSQYYFASDFAPNRTAAEGLIEKLLRDAGLRLATRNELGNKVKGLLQVFFRDALASLKSEARIVELKRGQSTFYVHRESLLGQLRLAGGRDAIEPADADTRAVHAMVTLADVRPIYDRLKAEQGGISAVKIYDIMCRLSATREDLHRLLLEEERNGHVSLHRASTAGYPREVTEAGIRLPGQPEPLVTVIVKG